MKSDQELKYGAREVNGPSTSFNHLGKPSGLFSLNNSYEFTTGKKTKYFLQSGDYNFTVLQSIHLIRSQCCDASFSDRSYLEPRLILLMISNVVLTSKTRIFKLLACLPDYFHPTKLCIQLWWFSLHLHQKKNLSIYIYIQIYFWGLFFLLDAIFQESEHFLNIWKIYLIYKKRVINTLLSSLGRDGIS